MPSGSKNKVHANSKKETRKPVKGKQNSVASLNGVKAWSKDSLSQVPVELQQPLLDIFKRAFSGNFNDDLTGLIQEVKQNLFHRDFYNAFDKETSLEAYAIRWSPSRALVYLNILCNLPDLVSNLTSFYIAGNAGSQQSVEFQEDASIKQQPSVQIVCLGGGAGGELVALAGCLKLLSTNILKDPLPGLPENHASIKLNITVIDIADWSGIMDKLYTCITTNPPISRYASTTAQLANKPLVNPNEYEVRFLKQDILDMDEEKMKAALLNARLVTLMFTLNELYNASVSATTQLLLSMTSVLCSGSLVLVVDSPGSYSMVKLNKHNRNDDSSAQNKYPMQWLLDHTLLETAATRGSKTNVQEKKWEKLCSHNSTWFRLPVGLKYPISLEDVRYQVHLYRRL